MLNSRILPGMMDLRLVFEKPTKIRNDTTYEQETTWSTLGKFPAYKNNALRRRGGTGFEASQEVTTNIDDYVIRYSSEVLEIDATYRFYDAGFPDEYYYVTLVQREKREGRIYLRAERRDNE